MRSPPLHLVVAIGLLAGVSVEPAGLLAEFSRTIATRPVGPRLSTSPGYRECAASGRDVHAIPVLDCGGQGDARPPPAAVRPLGSGGDARVARVEALHVEGLLGLLGRTGTRPLDTSVRALERAAGLAPRHAGILADLSAAYLVRAGRTQNPRDLLQAIENAERALEAAPRSAPARFNLALSLDWFGLEDAAMQAWDGYLAVDSTSGWAGEARRRLHAMNDRGMSAVPPAAADRAELAGLVARDPQRARLLGLDTLLGEWGAAVLGGDSAAAAERLGAAVRLGEALLDRGGDATLAGAVDAVRAASRDPAAVRRLAEAHAAYAAGQAAYGDVDYRSARAHFRRVLDGRAPSPHLRSWAQVFHAAMLAQDGEMDEALRTLGAVADTDTARYPALAGRAQWVAAAIHLRTGRYEAALRAAEDGARLLERAGETGHQGGALYVAADARFLLGATLATHATAHRALSVLRRDRGSVWLLNTLAVAARAAEADGLHLAAIRLQDERVALARRHPQPARLAEALLARARMLVGLGMHRRARADLAESQRLLPLLPPGNSHAWLVTELRLARAELLAASDPAGAAASLDSVLAAPGGALIAPRRLRAHVRRAEARLALADPAGATADLHAASLLLIAERDSISRTEYRVSLLEAARGVFERIAMLRLAAGDTLDALAYIEEGRASFASAPRDAGPAVRRWRTRPGEVAVTYALVGDTLLAWVIAGDRVQLVRRHVDRASLAASISELRVALERAEEGPRTHRALADLHELLVAPVEARIADAAAGLVVVADGELGEVPFAALRDGRRGRYLVESREVRFAASLRDATRPRPSRRRTVRPAAALLVADPHFDARVHPGLERLPGARREVAAIAAEYPAHVLLAGSEADRAALIAALPSAAVVHFAGHAVYDDRSPGRSLLVLAPERSGSDVGWLTAAELEGLPLRHVELVVLSACQSLRSSAGRAGGLSGFAGPLLRAGARGLVGSLWRVDDRLTAPLMVELHDAHRRTGDGAAALRAAQLRLLHGRDPALRSPGAWAAFRYVGD